MEKCTRPALAGLLVALSACADGGDEASVVARVDDHRLTVDQVVELLVDEEALASDVNNIRSLAELWIDYTLLAEAADRDTTFRQLDLQPLVDRQIWQNMVVQLRDSVIQVDTFITEGELEALYEEESPEVEVRARHIMLTFPVQATQPQRDSIRERIEEIRAEIVAGSPFEAMARQYSHDRGSASQGGDVGYFGRGEMVAPFEQAAMALRPGEVSDVVATPMGLHLIRVDDRRTRGFVEAAPGFRQRVQLQRVQQAESTFVAAIRERVTPEISENAAEITREVARTPGASLSGRAARRSLVAWRGGEVTVGELRTLLRLEGAPLRSQIANADDARVEQFLDQLARRELLVEEARSAGLQPSRERVDSLIAVAATQLRQAARTLGLFDIEQAPGEPRELAIARTVEEALMDNLTGATQFVPLGVVSFELRDRASHSIDDSAVGQAIVRIAQVRASRTLAPGQGAAPVPDTTGQ